MRGKAEVMQIITDLTRITPAYAGKSSVANSVVTRAMDHPRLCGEKFTGDKNKIRHIGSPPPMRGKGSPAHILLLWSQDHPRLCGEKRARSCL